MTAASMGRRTGDDQAGRQRWAGLYAACRGRTLALAEPLTPEDQQVQSMPDVSPTKWHLAHMTWFFETFLLAPHRPGYAAFDPQYGFLFNSYYEAVGPRWSRPARGLLSRPSVDDILAYRRHVDAAMAGLIAEADEAAWAAAQPLLELGLHHEQQHQELLLMDIKHVFSLNPLAPAYQPARARAAASAPPLDFVRFAGGLIEIGHDGEDFAFDNEGPRHRVWLEPFALAGRLSTCGDYLAFVEDGGYARPELWLSEGWAAVQREGWAAPLYWQAGGDGERMLFTLQGLKRLDPAEPVCHLSFFEADAFARWSGRRLPTEAEWELAALSVGGAPVARSSGLSAPDPFHPQPAHPTLGLRQMAGDLWQWTASAYAPYPRYRPADGAIGEYNGKFMSGQMVLRGGACVTPEGHTRPSYRNFFPPAARWAFSGVRLADDA